MGNGVEKFNWPDPQTVIPQQKWIRIYGLYSQHRLWNSDDFRLICTQDYNAEDYTRIAGVAEAFGVLDQILDFKANVKDPFDVETFYGNDTSDPMMFRGFLCTGLDTLTR
jgi:hypothetical protein